MPSSDDGAAIDDRQVGDEAVGLLEVVRRQQDRQVLGAAQLLDLLPHRDAHLGIEAGRRLVEEEDARTVHERHRDVEAPLHPARVAARDPVGGLLEPDLLEQVLHALLDLAAAHAEDAALQAQVLAAGERDVDAVLLLDDADAAPHARRVASDVEVRDPRRARVGVRQRGEDLHCRRLSGAVRPEQAEHRALRHREREPVERADAARIGLDEVLGFDRVHLRTVT